MTPVRENCISKKTRLLELARQRREELVQAGLSLLRDPAYLAERAQLEAEAKRWLRKFLCRKKAKADVAQMAEHRFRKSAVGGSTPLVSSMKIVLAKKGCIA